MDFEVNRHDFRQTQVVEPGVRELEPGQLRLAVERFAFTANNVSYALSGDLLGYWDFFPTAAPWGRLPTMGLGSVAESAHAEIRTGGRYFGFYPMSTELVIDARRTSGGFADVGEHRRGHASAYVNFLDVDDDPTFRDDRADQYLILRGMFMTSFLVEDLLEDHAHFGAEQTLVTSASSKTSIALAHCLAARDQPRIGITSARNQSFVEGLGLYDRVITYEDIASLDASIPSVLVDMAGDADVRSRLHHHFAASLRYSCQVGATHWEQTGGQTDLPGPTPEFFFAPSQMQKRDQDWGPGELTARIGAAFGTFLDGTPRWLHIERSAGPDAVAAVYLDTVEGRTSPDTGHILSLSPTAF